MTRRLLASYLGLTLLALLALEIPLGYVYARGELTRFSQLVERDAVMLAEVAEEEIEEGNTAALPALASDYADRTGAHVVVVDRRGIALADSGSPSTTGTDLSAEPDIATALHNRPTTGTRHDPARGADVLAATIPGSSGTTVRGALRLTYPTAAVTDRVHTVWLSLALGGAGVLAAAALVALALTQWITRPIRALEYATRQFADGNLADPPATHTGPRELRLLAATFTRTATQVQRLLRAQRSFASDASHQLKTPLTALRLRLENFEPYLDRRARPSLDEAIGEVERLSRMIHGLLALARLEHSATRPEAVDLDAVLNDRAATWTPFAAEQQVIIDVTGPPAGPVLALPGALEQIVDNLLANALRVAPNGSTITLTCTTPGADGHGGRARGTVDLHVVDQGPGMTEPERARAFDRFWRSPDSHHDGTGLGLPLVRQLAQAAHGDVLLRAAPDGGLDAVVRLRQAGRESQSSSDARWPAYFPSSRKEIMTGRQAEEFTRQATASPVHTRPRH